MCVIGNNKNCTSDKFKAVFAYTPTQNSLMCNYLVLIIKLNLGGDWGVLLLNGRVLVLILLVSMLCMRHGINHKSWKGTLLKMNYQPPIFHIIYDYSLSSHWFKLNSWMMCRVASSLRTLTKQCWSVMQWRLGRFR